MNVCHGYDVFMMDDEYLELNNQKSNIIIVCQLHKKPIRNPAPMFLAAYVENADRVAEMNRLHGTAFPTSA